MCPPAENSLKLAKDNFKIFYNSGEGTNKRLKIVKHKSEGTELTDK